jgi:hypothetical protein
MANVKKVFPMHGNALYVVICFEFIALCGLILTFITVYRILRIIDSKR